MLAPAVISVPTIGTHHISRERHGRTVVWAHCDVFLTADKTVRPDIEAGAMATEPSGEVPDKNIPCPVAGLREATLGSGLAWKSLETQTLPGGQPPETKTELTNEVENMNDISGVLSPSEEAGIPHGARSLPAKCPTKTFPARSPACGKQLSVLAWSENHWKRNPLPGHLPETKTELTNEARDIKRHFRCFQSVGRSRHFSWVAEPSGEVPDKNIPCPVAGLREATLGSGLAWKSLETQTLPGVQPPETKTELTNEVENMNDISGVLSPSEQAGIPHDSS